MASIQPWFAKVLTKYDLVATCTGTAARDEVNCLESLTFNRILTKLREVLFHRGLKRAQAANGSGYVCTSLHQHAFQLRAGSVWL